MAVKTKPKYKEFTESPYFPVRFRCYQCHGDAGLARVHKHRIYCEKCFRQIMAGETSPDRHQTAPDKQGIVKRPKLKQSISPKTVSESKKPINKPKTVSKIPQAIMKHRGRPPKSGQLSRTTLWRRKKEIQGVLAL